MPFLNLNTNLPKEKVTAETMNKLAQEMSVILGKDTKWINWMLSTDKLMSRVRLKCCLFDNVYDTLGFTGCHCQGLLWPETRTIDRPVNKTSNIEQRVSCSVYEVSC